MPRRRGWRRIQGQFPVDIFKPAGVPASMLEEIIIEHDEWEALRLVDYEGKTQEEAASQMKVSQPTLSRILNEARRKLAKAIVEGKAIRIIQNQF